MFSNIHDKLSIYCKQRMERTLMIHIKGMFQNLYKQKHIYNLYFTLYWMLSSLSRFSLLKTISPNSVCHVNKYYKTPWFFSEFSGEYSEAADHLCKYKGFPEKYKGKTSPTFFLQKRGFIMRFYSSTLGTSLLMSRRVDRHPSWKYCMHRKLHAQLHAHAILVKSSSMDQSSLQSTSLNASW